MGELTTQESFFEKPPLQGWGHVSASLAPDRLAATSRLQAQQKVLSATAVAATALTTRSKPREATNDV